MLSDSAQREEINKKLDLIIEVQLTHTENIGSLNKRFLGFEHSFTFMQQKTGECLTYIKRIQPFVDRAMRALHSAFQMVANGILNLREEQSEFAGSVIDETLDVKFV